MTSLVTPATQRGALLRWALICVPGVLLLGLLSGYLSGSSGENPWFAALEKPELYPPAATFGIAWTILYILLGLALAIVGAAPDTPARRSALTAFAVQLALNLAWSPVFFGAHQITAALIVILALDVAVILTLVLFWRVSRLAAVLLLPYLAWILFATVLNWQILQLNPGA
jgi:translocator protein